MFTNLIENRGREFTNLLKIGDYLGRTLRQNVELFSVEDGEVTYITESGHVVKGNYVTKPDLKLTNIIVENSDVLEDQKVFEKIVERKISGLLGNLLEDDYKSAEGSFDKILSMFETKLSYGRIKNRLAEKTERFGEQTKIMESEEFSRLLEMKSKLIEHLKTNKNILNDGAIRSGVKLSNLVSNSFDLPKKTLDQIQEARTLVVHQGIKPSVYDYLCRKELVQKELLESKVSFDKMWINHDGIHDLASLVMESDEEVIKGQIAKVIVDLPYFALSTKKQLHSLISNSLSLAEAEVAKKDINSFIHTIYDMKKPVKTIVLKTLNEKYGIDIRKLDEVPTFRTLLVTESEILKRIASTVDSKSVLHKSLIEMADSLKVKNGAESIDLADFLNEMFKEANYTEVINETSLMSYMDFSRVADDLSKIGQVLKMLSPMLGGGDAGGGMNPMAAMGADPMAAAGKDPMAADPMTAVTPGEEMGAGTPPQDPLGSPDPMDADSENPGMEAGPEMGMEGGPDAQDIADEVLGGDELPGEEGDLPPEEGMEGEEELDFGDDEMLDGEEEPMEADDMTAKLTQIQDLLASILGEDDGEMDFEGGEEEGFEDEEEFEDEGDEFEDPDDDEDFVEEDEEEDLLPKKKKPSGKVPPKFK